MAEVELLLTAGLVEFETVDPRHPDARHCLGEYFAELGQRFEAGFDPALTIGVDEFRPPLGVFVVATLRAEPIGCGALIWHGGGAADLKRMWVSGSVRGLGIGRRLLTELERLAALAGASAVRLETNRSLAEAIALYRSAGYVEVAPFNDEYYAHHWFEKPVGPSSDSGKRLPLRDGAARDHAGGRAASDHR